MKKIPLWLGILGILAVLAAGILGLILLVAGISGGLLGALLNPVGLVGPDVVLKGLGQIALGLIMLLGAGLILKKGSKSS